ncbi:recombination regulator RecX [Ruminococcaceae bacterium OttesenSCG-928-A11]|nr:recombination regulator RecX [Ruminococcaceae bacterium OttesenSCG-928-A11]
MTRITRISETKKGRFALFSGDEFLFSIDGETYMATGLEAGCDLSDADLLALKDRSDTRKASDAALRYLSLRAYGEQELYQKLLGRFDEHSAAAAVAKMCELDLLDDETFAREKAKGMAQRGKSPREIRQKLAALGIDRQVAAAAVDELEIDGADAALAIIRKSYMEKLCAGQHQKVMAALARRGFSHGEISRALAAAQAEGEEVDG